MSYIKKILTPKISDDKLDAVFYYGKEIMEFQFPNGKKLIFESRGELEIIDENHNKYKGINALEYLFENDFNDFKLGQISSEYDLLLANNWFEAILVDINGENLGDYGIFGDYDEVIEHSDVIAKELMKEFYS
jgi:hypothetical protein